VPLFQQTSLGRRSGPSVFEALREEVHRFDSFDHTPTVDRANVSCCTAAMQEIQVEKAHEQNKDPNRPLDEFDAKCPRHRESRDQVLSYAASAVGASAVGPSS
jgi:hypothetical protein